MLSIIYGNKEVCKISNTPEHLKFHTPKKVGDRSWKIVDEATQEVVDSYTPSRKTRPACQTSYNGSWAATVNK